jgi:hypothetical protein
MYIKFFYEEIGRLDDYYHFKISQEKPEGEKGWHVIPKAGCIAFDRYAGRNARWFFIEENGKQTRFKMSEGELEKALEILKNEVVELQLPVNTDAVVPEILDKVSPFIITLENKEYQWWQKQLWYAHLFQEHLRYLKKLTEKIGEQKAKELWKEARQIAKRQYKEKENVMKWTIFYFGKSLKDFCECYDDLAEYIVIKKNYQI